MQDLTKQDLNAEIRTGNFFEVPYNKFLDFIRQPGNEKPVFVSFMKGFRTTTLICNAVRELMDRAALNYPSCYFLGVNIQRYFRAGIDYSICSPPTTLLLHHGTEYARLARSAGHGLDYMAPDVEKGLPVVHSWIQQTLASGSLKIFSSRAEADRANAVPGIVGLQGAACVLPCP